MSCGCLKLQRFHWLMMIIWQFAFLFACQQLSSIFSNYTPQWKCYTTENNTFESATWSKNCSVVQLCKPTDLVFHPVTPFFSAVQEFQLLCGNEAYFAALISTVQFAGVLVGSLVIGHFGDAFGRKRVTLLTVSGGILVACCSGKMSLNLCACENFFKNLTFI